MDAPNTSYTTQPDRPATEVMGNLDRLAQEGEALLQALDTLSSRLAPVMRDPQPEPESEKMLHISPVTHVGSRIADGCERLSVARRIVLSLIDRLEV